MASRLLTVAAVLWALLSGCVTPGRVRLDTGQGTPLEYRPPSNTSVRVDAEAFEDALKQRVSHGMTGGTALLASRLAMLPRFTEAAAVGASHLRLTLSEIGQVSAVAISADGTITMTLAPTAVTMAAGKTSSGGGTSEGALETAESGGRHAGFMRNYQGKPPGELRRGIDSLKKQIAEHKDKIANPEKYIPNWKSLDPRQQKALMDKKWPSDIQRQTEQLEILEGLLKKAQGSGPT